MVTTIAAAARQGGPSVGLPEGVHLAPLGRRLGAFGIDALAPYVLVIIAISVLAGGGSGWPAVILFLLPLAWAALQWWLCATRAATAGMRLMRLQVVGLQDGRPIGWARALIRGLILSVVGGSVILLIVMGVMMLGQTRRQGWHDLAADSVVIEERPLAPRLPRDRPAVRPQPMAPTAAAVPEPAADPADELDAMLADSSDGAADDPGAGWAAARADDIDHPDEPAGDVGGPVGSEPSGQPAPPPPNQGWYAVLDDEQELAITRLILFGRNPQPRAGEEDALLIKVVDEARTVSKTHLALNVDSRGVLVSDRGSTNGSAVTDPYGVYRLLTAEEPVRLPTEGYLVSFGNHQLRIVRH